MQAPASGSMVCLPSLQGAVPLIINTDTQGTGTAQAVEGKPQTTKEKDVDALTFMRTVLMSFVGEMDHGEQTLPTNDLFVCAPAQILQV